MHQTESHCLEVHERKFHFVDVLYGKVDCHFKSFSQHIAAQKPFKDNVQRCFFVAFLEVKTNISYTKVVHFSILVGLMLNLLVQMKNNAFFLHFHESD